MGWSEKHGKPAQFRVDRMTSVELLAQPALPAQDFDPTVYVHQVFGMFGASIRRTALLCENITMRSVVDRFGKEVQTEIVDGEHFQATVDVAPSPPFFASVFTFGGKIRITEPEEYQILASRWEEMLSLAEEIIWRHYLNPKSDELMSEVDSFPGIRYLTGNYYVGDVSYGYAYRDKRHRPYQIKEGRLRHKYHNGKEWISEWLPLDCPEITRHYRILLHLRLTGDESGKEEDYMGLDLIVEFEDPNDFLEFEILSHDVI